MNGFAKELALMLIFAVVAIPLRMFTDFATWQITVAGLISVLIAAGLLSLVKRPKKAE